MSLDLTSFSPILKTLYPEGVQYLTYKENPFLAMVPKNPKFVGEDMKVPVVYANTGARSTQISKVWSNDTSSKQVAFRISRARHYGLARMNRETLKASEGAEGAIIAAYKHEMDSALNAVKNGLGQSVCSDGSACIGQIVSVAGGIITLANPDDSVFYEEGLKLEASTQRTGGSVRTGTGTVTAVDREEGKITYTANSGWSPAADDFLFNEGDYGAGLKGLASWLPWTKPTSGDSFFGVDRSKDTVRLAGCRIDGSSRTYQEALIAGAVRTGREEGAPDHVFVSFHDWEQLQYELNDKVTIQQVMADVKDNNSKVIAQIGFSAIVIVGPRGPMKVIADKNLVRGYGYGVTMKHWCLHSLGDAPHVVDDDGLVLRRIQGSDTFGTEIASYSQLGCEAPGRNFVVKFSSAT